MAGSKRKWGGHDVEEENLSVSVPPGEKKKIKSDLGHNQQPISLPFKVDVKFYLTDVTNGQEKSPIPCMNWRDDESLTKFEYMSTYTADTNVTIPVEEGFMVHCNCQDGRCIDGSCPCRQLTFEESKGLLKASEAESTGYVDGKLTAKMTSGIYECNQYCTCSSNCTNRLVQYGIQQSLLIYKTEKMGWGVMTLKDIPQGTFICCYVGQICTDETADARGIKLGDSYMAELDYIEVVELIKADCESDIDSPPQLHVNQDEEDMYYVVPLSSDDIAVSSPLSSSTQNTSSISDEGNRYDVSLTDSRSSSVASISLPSCRWYYNEDHCYIIDSQNCGNIARFLNHSCSPNLFVQNVFVNSHDLRFPWVAFFTKTSVPAYTELFWDYNYVIGSVEGKEMPCHCGSINCRKRLL